MIRFHSFYPWHTGGDYRQLCGEQDLAMLPWVQEFKYGHPGGVGGRRAEGDVGGFSSRHCPSLNAVSLTCTPSVLTCQTWTSCGPTTRGLLTSTAPVS